MIAKLGVVLLLLIIVYCLLSALVFMIRGRLKSLPSESMIKALTWRIILSACLFLFLIASYWLGWVKPHGVIPNPAVSSQPSPGNK
jgi:hypothetical protein